MTSRSFIGTIFQDEKPQMRGKCRYMCGQMEICPKTGRKHWQIYCEFTSSLRPKGAAREIDCDGSHMEPKRYGNNEFMEQYCRKSKTAVAGTYFEEGEKVSQGVRKDLKELSDSLIKGEQTVEDILINDPIKVHQYGRTLDRAETVRLKKNVRTERTIGVWIHGLTGTGKSHYLKEEIKGRTYYSWNVKSIFQCGYKQQEIVVLDDFRGEIPFQQILKMADDTPFLDVDRKGLESIPFNSKKLLITSAKHPLEVFRHSLSETDRFDQFTRRFTIIETKNEKCFEVVKE